MAARQRWVFVTTSYPAAPEDYAGHFVRAEVRQAAAAGHSVSVIAPGPNPAAYGGGLPALGLFGPSGALPRLRNNPLRLLGGAAFAAAARRALARLGPIDRLVAHWLVPCAFPIAVGHTAASKTAVAHGGDVRVLTGLPQPVVRRVLDRLESDGTRLRFVAEQLRQDLDRHVGGHPLVARATVRPSPLDLPTVPDRSEARRRCRIEGERIAVIVGRLIPGKRVDRAIAAARGDLLRPVVIGDGPLRRELSRQHPTATFLGQLPRNETLTWLAAADVLISASRSEGAPTTIREARALGIRVWSAPAGDVVRWAATDPGIYVDSRL